MNVSHIKRMPTHLTMERTVEPIKVLRLAEIGKRVC